MSQIYASILLILYTGIITLSEATRCFECTGVPYPRDCTKVVTCGANEVCSTEQIVTTSGHIVYNLGCLTKDRCSLFTSLPLMGKRDLNMTARSSTDISTCVECCSGDFCNNKGCGAQPVPLGQRGPYCYNCKSVLDLSACDEVAVCLTNEECMLYSPPEYNGLPETVYRSQCETKLGCNALAQAFSNYKCPPMCCGTDFCNDHCGMSSNSSMSTPAHQTTVQPAQTHPASVATTQQPVVTNPPVLITTTQQPVVTNPPVLITTTQEFRCKQDHYYDDITGMCIKIDETRKLNQAAAKRACEDIGDQLVTIDSHEKTIFVENMILHHSRLLNEKERTYYIGLFDKYDKTEFYWPNGNKLYYTNWGGGDMEAPNRQPDDGPGVHQDCVILWGPDHYRWHDDPCSLEQYFICEDTTHLKQTPNLPEFRCKQDHYYDDITGMCIKIDETRKLNQAAAKRACEDIGDQLVTIDSHEKTIFVENMILHHSRLLNEKERTYYIGLYDKYDKTEFYWPNGNKLYYTNWGGGDMEAPNRQPDDGPGVHQDCVILWGPDHYRWHDDPCSLEQYFICEDTTHLKQTPNLPGATPSSGTNQSHCEHDGYIYLHNNNAQLCVHIVTNYNLEWGAAQSQCKKEHGDLVVLDTHDKALLMRQKIQAGFSDRTAYWIGGKDFQSTDQFSWVNGVRINDQNADWDRGQPNHNDGGHVQDCAVMWKGSREPFQWHDDYCLKSFAFICERY